MARVCSSAGLCVHLKFTQFNWLVLTAHHPLTPSVFPLISRRRFSQIEVLEGVNVLVCINGRKNKLRVYYLSWLRNKILNGDDVSMSVLSVNRNAMNVDNSRVKDPQGFVYV